ncbi:NADP-dependent oxidoreductase [Streptomyces sp. NPDC056192]|uniref:NADP-dependent oxidoreductase n=1 Tax=Streptomyces sp. NPDC056192 TaxID=3345743 RepID=UPI0035DF3780
MKAAVITTFGDPEVLHEADIDVPEPEAGQIRIRIRAIGVNPIEAKIRSGAFQMPLPAVLGFEFAGVVDAVGERVSDVRPGDRVVGWPDGPVGSYAELTVSSTYVAIPDTVSFEDAAAVLVAADTASRVLAELAIRTNETLLLHGASGAVGSVAAQLAVARGVRVIGTSGAASRGYVESLGAIAVEYGDGLVERVRAAAPDGVDAVFDAAGKNALPASINLRGGTDRIVTIADPTAGGLGVAFSAGTSANRNLDGVRDAVERLAERTLSVRIGHTLPLRSAPAAHRLIESGHPGGKVLLVP